MTERLGNHDVPEVEGRRGKGGGDLNVPDDAIDDEVRAVG